jgi:Holliday junction resolvase-like predicted endonuclease
MGIAKYLKVGKIRINASEKQIEIADRQIIISYDKLMHADWGYVYEKFVGQILEEEGYEVIYQGLEKGWLDRGIDLIAIKNNELNFVQCKYVSGIISKNKIEWILFKASGILYENHKKYGKPIHFTLIVNKKDECFSKSKPKNFRLNFTDNTKVTYPILQYFLDHNFVQDKVKLEFREIEMIR